MKGARFIVAVIAIIVLLIAGGSLVANPLYNAGAIPSAILFAGALVALANLADRQGDQEDKH
jgi:hypothetical protein